MAEPFVTVVEHPHYLKLAEKLLTIEQIKEVSDILAANPGAGEIMQGTGGCRKMRYAGTRGKGKSGGQRVIHLFVTKRGEVHLLDIYGKTEKDNLTKAQRNELAQLAAMLKGKEQ